MTHESWLKSNDSKKYAKAAMLCEHAGGFCMSDGYCHFDGRCFRRGRGAVSAAIKAIERAATEELDDVAGEMRLAATLLNRSWSDGEAIDRGDG